MTDLPHIDKLPLFQRLTLLGCGVFLLGGFALAASVQPDPRGFGTHQQFGLPPCSFQMMLGIACPSCGGTTCFAHFVRGDWGNAASANPAVFAFALLCLVAIPWSFYSCWRGELYGVRDLNLCAVWLLTGIGAFAMLTWMLRILVNGS